MLFLQFSEVHEKVKHLNLCYVFCLTSLFDFVMITTTVCVGWVGGGGACVRACVRACVCVCVVRVVCVCVCAVRVVCECVCV